MTLTGNTGKVQIIKNLHMHSLSGKKIKVLDIGCGDLNLWQDTNINFENLDIHCLDRNTDSLMVAKERARSISPNFHFYESDISNFPELVGLNTFDIIVSTQVLEHVKDLGVFFNNCRRIIKDGGMGYFTCDYAKFRNLKNPNLFERKKKELISKFYLRPITEEMIRTALPDKKISFAYYCIDPLKYIHNHIVKEDDKNYFMSKWREIENYLNNTSKEQIRQYCSVLYFGVEF